MEIEVGEYIRTEEGLIGKVSFIQDKVYFMKDIYDYTPEKTITKHSKNIIDLIEIGDYINGERVTYITKTKTGRTQIITEDSTDFFLKYEYIKTILTHEQYEQNCYKLKE